MNLAAINAAIKNGNAVANNLANEEKYVEAGVVHSLTQAIRVLYVDGQRLLAEQEKLIVSDSKAYGMLRQVLSDLQFLISGDDQVTVNVQSLSLTTKSLADFLTPKGIPGPANGVCKWENGMGVVCSRPLPCPNEAHGPEKF